MSRGNACRAVGAQPKFSSGVGKGSRSNGRKSFRSCRRERTCCHRGRAVGGSEQSFKARVVIELLSTDAVKVSPGARVFIEAWGGPEALEARVRLIEPSAFTKVSALGIEEQRVNVIADLTAPSSVLGDGYRVEGRIVVWHSDSVLQVPVSALFRRAMFGVCLLLKMGEHVYARLKLASALHLQPKSKAALRQTRE